MKQDLVLNIDTFIANAEQDEACVKYGWQKGTIEATLHNETRVVPCTFYGNGEYAAHATSFVTKYRTGSKLWPASIVSRVDNKGVRWENVNAGFDSRSGKHILTCNVFFYEERHEKHMSKR